MSRGNHVLCAWLETEAMPKGKGIGREMRKELAGIGADEFSRVRPLQPKRRDKTQGDGIVHGARKGRGDLALLWRAKLRAS